jgi:hypothetical protein
VDYAYMGQDAADRAVIEQRIAENARGEEERRQRLDDWRDCPPEQVVTWRHADRARLDARRATEAAEARASASGVSLGEELAKLKDLYEAGTLTDEEFAAAKAKALGT